MARRPHDTKGLPERRPGGKISIRGTNSPQRRATVARCVECHQSRRVIRNAMLHVISSMPSKMPAPLVVTTSRHVALQTSDPKRCQTANSEGGPTVRHIDSASDHPINVEGEPAWSASKLGLGAPRRKNHHHITTDVKVTACQHHRLCCHHRRHASAMPPNRIGREPHHAPYT